MIIGTICPSCSECFVICTNCGKPTKQIGSEKFCSHCGLKFKEEKQEECLGSGAAGFRKDTLREGSQPSPDNKRDDEKRG